MPKNLLSYLSALKSAQLKHLGLLTGIPTNGTKPELLPRLTSSLPSPLLPQDSPKILSIDLGIRNLGICVVSPTFPPLPSPTSPSLFHFSKVVSPLSSERPKLHIHHWSRTTLSHPSLSSQKTANDSQAPPPASLFTPPHLAPLAYTLVTQSLLPHAASTLLLERQRYRSGGGAAVQEWTVRVNTLEAMVWAIVETLGREIKRRGDGVGEEDKDGGPVPVCWSVEPGRVARFWLDGGIKGHLGDDGIDGGGKGGRRRAADVKREKIGLVRGWLEGREGAPFELGFEEGPERVKDVLLQPPKRRSGKKESETEDAEVMGGIKAGKLDDLADCFLQAATWIQWEWNRRRIINDLQSIG